MLAALTVPHEGPVAVRGDEAWVRCYQPHPLAPDDEHPFAGPGETVLITDGLGPTALPLALRLARAHGPRLVLTTPVPLPDRAHRDRFADDDGPVGRAVRAVAALEATGAPCWCCPSRRGTRPRCARRSVPRSTASAPWTCSSTARVRTRRRVPASRRGCGRPYGSCGR